MPKVILEKENNLQEKFRINRFLALSGLGSRRACENLVTQGNVVINGSTVRSLSCYVNDQDDVRVNGRIIRAKKKFKTIILNKPVGYITTAFDPFAQHTVYDLLPPELRSLFHVGRLDKESDGLLLLTNDGNLAQKLSHPSHGVEKEYEVIVDQPFKKLDGEKMKKGMWMDRRVANIHAFSLISDYKIRLILKQGIKRQIRIMLSQLNFKVKKLSRISYGPFTLRGIPVGSYKELTVEDLKKIEYYFSKNKS